MKRFLAILFIFMMTCSQGFCASEWTKLQIDGGESPSDIDALNQVNNEAQDRLLANYREGFELLYASAATLTVTAGEIVCSNSAGSVRHYRQNPSNTTVTWSSIDTKSESVSTRYYVFAVADADATTATISITTSATSPTGATYYKKLGSFYNNASGNIEQVNSSKLVYDSDDVEFEYDSGWFTANIGGTLYTKAHGISLTFPEDGLDVIVLWRSSSSSSYMTNCTRFFDGAENTEGLGYDGTNLYLKATYAWARYYNSVGSSQTAGNGELRVLANKIT